MLVDKGVLYKRRGIGHFLDAALEDACLGRRTPALSEAGPWLPVAAGLVAGALLWTRRLRR